MIFTPEVNFTSVAYNGSLQLPIAKKKDTDYNQSSVSGTALGDTIEHTASGFEAFFNMYPNNPTDYVCCKTYQARQACLCVCLWPPVDSDCRRPLLASCMMLISNELKRFLNQLCLWLCIISSTNWLTDISACQEAHIVHKANCVFNPPPPTKKKKVAILHWMSVIRCVGSRSQRGLINQMLFRQLRWGKVTGGDLEAGGGGGNLGVPGGRRVRGGGGRGRKLNRH